MVVTDDAIPRLLTPKPLRILAHRVATPLFYTKHLYTTLFAFAFGVLTGISSPKQTSREAAPPPPRFLTGAAEIRLAGCTRTSNFVSI